jgi:hypothetical protein
MGFMLKNFRYGVRVKTSTADFKSRMEGNKIWPDMQKMIEERMKKCLKNIYSKF